MIVHPVHQRIWHWVLFGALAALAMFIQLLPINLDPARLPGPDWLVVIAFSWVLRRPDYIPAPLVASLVFLEDLLFMRPPGLWAAISLAGLEFLRGRARFSRALPFGFEWLMFSGVYLAMLVANRIMLAIFFVPPPRLALEGVQLLATIIAYPLVSAISAYIFGVRKMAPGSVDELGHRI